MPATKKAPRATSRHPGRGTASRRRWTASAVTTRRTTPISSPYRTSTPVQNATVCGEQEQQAEGQQPVNGPQGVRRDR